ncbi:MAG: hypothetical protein JWN56_2677 [Sphingobacteriales bacterium]|nr:hypothetical protein [Sphingobacteriales bacterium]
MKIRDLFFIFSMIMFVKCTYSEKISNLNATNIKIKLSSDNKNVEFYPLPDYALRILKSDSLSQKQYENLFAVYLETNDEDIRDLQEPIQGTYYITDTSIIFSPKSEFKKNQAYYAICNIKNLLLDPSEIITSQKMPGRESPVQLNSRLIAVNNKHKMNFTQCFLNKKYCLYLCI